MMPESKRCPKCGEVKPINAFRIQKTKRHRDKPYSYCNQCSAEYESAYKHRKYNIRYMADAKDSSAYLGIYIAERALSKFFDKIERMPVNNQGYDFKCGRGYKIDSKAACARKRQTWSPCWDFCIKRNTIPDYFLLLAFKNRTELEPVHVWLVPGHVINCFSGISISDTEKALFRWLPYERPIDKVVACCDKIRAEGLKA